MRSFIYFLLPLFFYPVYFAAVNIVDSIIGDQQLINWLYFDSKSQLLETFFMDWVSSIPVMYLVFFILIKPVDFLSNKYMNGSKSIVYLLTAVTVLLMSYLVGFREVALISNAIAVCSIIAFYYFSSKVLMARLK